MIDKFFPPAGIRIIFGIAIAGALSFSSAEASDGNSTEGLLEEVIVTAQKREQSLQDVPLSIAVLTTQTLEDTGLTGIQDLAQLVPGLVFAETLGRQTSTASLRGVAPFSFADETVMVMIDGYTSGFNRSGTNATLLDIERIEVLRGPQATLYGRNAIGGVINYITHKPGEQIRGRFRLDVASYDTTIAQASLSGPIVSDKLFGSVALGYRKFGGFMFNDATGIDDVNDEQDKNARVGLRFTPNERWDINLTIDGNEADDDVGTPNYAYQELYLSSDPPTTLDIGAGEVDFNQFRRAISQAYTGGFDRDEKTAVLDIQYDLGWATLTSITGTSDQETSIRAPLPPLETARLSYDVQWDIESTSQEFRLTSSTDTRWQWLAGAYIFDNKRTRMLLLDAGSGWTLAQKSTDEVDNYALFGNVQYQVTTSTSLQAGLRYDSEERTQTNVLNGKQAEASNEELLPSVSLLHSLNDTVNLYATISLGYHAGGPNEIGSIEAGAPETYAPEYLTNYEIGVKGTLPSASLSYEAAAFYMDWEDQQIFINQNVLNRFIVNAGESEILGLELLVNFAPVEGLLLTASISWLDAEYTDFYDPISARPYGLDPQMAGNDLIYSSGFSGSASAQYIFPVGERGWDIRLRADYSHVGERPFDVTNLFIADSYDILNLYAGIQNERIELGFFADNVFDENYLVGGSPAATPPPFGVSGATIGDPRVYGARMVVRW